MMLAIHDNW